MITTAELNWCFLMQQNRSTLGFAGKHSMALIWGYLNFSALTKSLLVINRNYLVSLMATMTNGSMAKTWNLNIHTLPKMESQVRLESVKLKHWFLTIMLIWKFETEIDNPFLGDTKQAWRNLVCITDSVSAQSNPNSTIEN